MTTQNEKPGARLGRLAQAEFAAAVRGLARSGPGLHPGVHAARRALRHVRALLAVGRDELGHAGELLDRRLQRLVRSLSELRDAHVAYATLATVPGLPQRGRLQAALRGVRDELELDLLAADPGFATRRATLERLAPALAGLAWKRLGRKALRRGLERSRRRVDRAQAKAEAQPDLEQRHRWRRLMRRLHQQRQLLRKAEIAPAVGETQHARRMQHLLGRARDLHLLRVALQRLATLGAIDPVSWRAPLRASQAEVRNEIAAVT